MSHAPRIGITTYGRNAKGEFTLPAEYVDCVRRAGGLALTLTPGEPHPADWLALLDGIVLTGGGDLGHALWGGEGHPTVYGVDDERDRTELALARLVLQSDLPSLWICRGLQLLNIVRGGTLHEHLPDAVGTQLAHSLPPRETVPHPVHIEEGSRLAITLGTSEVVGVSWHHQAAADLGAGLRAVAHAPDGVIEAVELEGHPWLEAVQWHPELSAATDPVQQRLFDALTQRATRRRDVAAGRPTSP